MATPATPDLCSAFPVSGARLPVQVVKDLRSDQAGEAGAVCIYQGILRVSRDPQLCLFAQSHLATEKRTQPIATGLEAGRIYDRCFARAARPESRLCND
jgi:hypothetical protein